MSSPETFGFEPDENGDIQFMTVTTDFPITCFAEYMEWFSALVQLAQDNEGIMPIATFPEAPQGWNRGEA